MLLAAGHNWRPDHGSGRWAAAGLAVVALHGAALAAGLFGWQSLAPMRLPAAAVMIELLPIPVAPPAPQTQAVAAPVQPLSIPEPEAASLPAPHFDLPIPAIDPLPPAFPEAEAVLPPPPKDIPKIAPIAAAPNEKAAEKSVDKPKDKPKEPAKQKQKPKPAPTPEPEAAPAPVAQPAARSAQTAAVTAAPVTSAAVAAAPSAADVARIAEAKANWEELLQAHLRKRLRYPKSAQRRNQQGASFVFIRMNRDGMVQGYRLARSSGVAALDEEAMALIARAQPLPALPDDMPGAAIRFTVPITFQLSD